MSSGSAEAVLEAFTAAARDDGDRLDNLFYYGRVSSEVADEEGNTLLHEAAARGALCAAKAVVKRAVFWHTPARRGYLNCRNRAGFTALELARAANADALAAWLLALGASDTLQPPQPKRTPSPPSMLTRVPSPEQRFRPSSASVPFTSTPSPRRPSPPRPTTSPSAVSLPRRASAALALLESTVLQSLLSSKTDAATAACVRAALADVAQQLEDGAALARERSLMLEQLQAARELATRAAASARSAVAQDSAAQISSLRAHMAALSHKAQADASSSRDKARATHAALQSDHEGQLAGLERAHSEALAALESAAAAQAADLEAAALAKGYDVGYEDGAAAERESSSRRAAQAEMAAMLREALPAPPDASEPERAGASERQCEVEEVEGALQAVLADVAAEGGATPRNSTWAEPPPPPREQVRLRAPGHFGGVDCEGEGEEESETLASLRLKLRLAEAPAPCDVGREEEAREEALRTAREGLRPVSPTPLPALHRLPVDL